MQSGIRERAKDGRVKICIEAVRIIATITTTTTKIMKKSETNKKIESTANITDNNGSNVERRSRTKKKTIRKYSHIRKKKELLLNRFVFSWLAVRSVVRSTDSGYIRSIHLIVISISPYEIRISANST